MTTRADFANIDWEFRVRLKGKRKETQMHNGHSKKFWKPFHSRSGGDEASRAYIEFREKCS
jgi:hypothetical protein